MLWKTLLTYQTSMFHSGRSTVFAIKHCRCYSNINEDQTLKLSNEKVIPELDESQVERAPYFQDPSTQRIRSARKGQRWIDSLRVLCKGGNGGNGLPKFGGVGGRGGQVYITSVNDKKKLPNLYTMFKTTFQGESKNQRLVASRGGDARKTCILGAPGKDIETEVVPVGVTITNDRGQILHDLDVPGIKIKLASGGAGGGPTNNWLGQRGEKNFVRIELKLMADIGLVGFPNAGKSTLLKAISRAKPKIASYPFTTIKPNLGHLEYQDGRLITMADLPGLIEGAHYNVGMGHKFLKHVERTRMLIFVVDVHGFRLHPHSEMRSAFDTLVLLNRELELYNSDLLEKPCLCLVNKMDLDNSKQALDNLESELLNNYEEAVLKLDEELRPEKRIVFDEIIPISAKRSQKTVNYVKDRLRYWIDENDDQSRSNEMSLSLQEDVSQAQDSQTPMLT